MGHPFDACDRAIAELGITIASINPEALDTINQVFPPGAPDAGFDDVDPDPITDRTTAREFLFRLAGAIELAVCEASNTALAPAGVVDPSSPCRAHFGGNAQSACALMRAFIRCTEAIVGAEARRQDEELELLPAESARP